MPQDHVSSNQHVDHDKHPHKHRYDGLRASDSTPSHSHDVMQSPSRYLNNYTVNHLRHHSDPFVYDSPGAIPFIPPRAPSRVRAAGNSGSPFTKNSDRFSRGAELSGFNPYPRRGDGPRRPPLGSRGSSRKLDFTPYFDLSNSPNKIRGGNIENRSRSDLGVRPPLWNKDVNQKPHQDSWALRSTAHQLRIFKKPNSVSPNSTKLHSVNQSSRSPELRPVRMPKYPHPDSFPWNGTIEAVWMSDQEEVPLPLKIVKKNICSRPLFDESESTSMTDIVRQLRAKDQALQLRNEIQEKELAKLEIELQSTGLEFSRVEESNSHEELEDLDVIKPFNTLQPPPVPPKSSRRNSTVDRQKKGAIATDLHMYKAYASGLDDTDANLAQAVSGLLVFQGLPSDPLEHSSLQRKSLVPEGLELGKIQATKDGVKAERHAGSRLEPLTVSEIVTRDASLGGMMEGLRKDLAKSVESFATSTSDGFERNRTSTGSQTERNGRRRYWFKFRR